MMNFKLNKYHLVGPIVADPFLGGWLCVEQNVKCRVDWAHVQ